MHSHVACTKIARSDAWKHTHEQGTGKPSDQACVKRGSPLVDTFRLLCEGWSDSDGPLTYQFGWYVKMASSNAPRLTVGGPESYGSGDNVTWFERYGICHRYTGQVFNTKFLILLDVIVMTG